MWRPSAAASRRVEVEVEVGGEAQVRVQSARTRKHRNRRDKKEAEVWSEGGVEAHGVEALLERVEHNDLRLVEVALGFRSVDLLHMQRAQNVCASSASASARSRVQYSAVRGECIGHSSRLEARRRYRINPNRSRGRRRQQVAARRDG